MQIPAAQLDRDLAKALRHVYLISGDEPLTADEAADAVRAAARAQGYVDREVYFIDRSAPWDDVLNAAQALSLFSARKIVEIRMPGGKPGHGAKTLLQVIAAAGPDLLLLILTGKLDGATTSTEWVRAADAAGAWVNLRPVDTAAFPAWIRERAARESLQLDADAVAVIAAQTEGNLLAAHQEIQKLRLAGLTQAGAADVLASISPSSRFDVFKLGAAVLAGDSQRALQVLASLRSEGTEPVLVLWAILQEMRNLWVNLVPGSRLPGVWTSNSGELSQAMARLRRGDLSRTFMRLTERASRADRVAKGRLAGDAWDELAQLVLEFAGARGVLPLSRR
ncbi:MAG: DNA polymerase III subunit delta [Pseudomonadota bacterium]